MVHENNFNKPEKKETKAPPGGRAIDKQNQTQTHTRALVSHCMETYSVFEYFQH